jgi:ketosteroid isomerase-like protein
MNMNDQEKIKVAQEYFHRADQGRSDVLDLLNEDVEIYFPKFGIAVGRKYLAEMIAGFQGQLEFLQHDYDNLVFLPSGEHLVVEGTSRGRIAGKSWEGGKTPGGRFCNVFRFRNGRISTLHIYLDPDYTSEDAPRFRWGMQRTW